jgi:hypothetical protein
MASFCISLRPKPELHIQFLSGSNLLASNIRQKMQEVKVYFSAKYHIIKYDSSRKTLANSGSFIPSSRTSNFILI